MIGNSNGDRKFDKLRRQLLFYSGLVGVFTYIAIVTFLGKEFHFEVLIIFGTMMGISIAQGVDKK